MPQCQDALGRQYFMETGACFQYGLNDVISGLASQANPNVGSGAAREAQSAAGTTVQNTIQNNIPGLSGLQSVGTFFNELADPTNQKRFALVAGGVLIVVLGVALILFGPAEKVATTGLEVAK